VPQVDPDAAADRADLDPLLAFNAELAAAEIPETSAIPPQPAAAPPPDEAPPLNARLEHAERSLDRALTEIATLKSDLVTLVAAVDDIRKRQSRRPDPAPLAPPVKPASRRIVGRAVAAIIVAAVFGAAIWGVTRLSMLDDAGPPPFDSALENENVAQGRPIETDAPVPPAEPAAVVPPPMAAAPPPPVELTTIAAAPPRLRAEPVRPAGYVGTLSIDAAPGGEVFLNRQTAGRTPLRVDRLRAGSHLVWIEREGYRRWTRVVTVSANRVSRVWADLEPQPAR
jgi:hypothetical protein